MTSLLTYGRIETTEAKAKELRRFADATITWGISVHALVAKGDKATPAERPRSSTRAAWRARRSRRATALDRLFAEIGPHFATPQGRLHAHPQDARPQGRRGADGVRRARRPQRPARGITPQA